MELSEFTFSEKPVIGHPRTFDLIVFQNGKKVRFERGTRKKLRKIIAKILSANNPNA